MTRKDIYCNPPELPVEEIKCDALTSTPTSRSYCRFGEGGQWGVCAVLSAQLGKRDLQLKAGTKCTLADLLSTRRIR